MFLRLLVLTALVFSCKPAVPAGPTDKDEQPTEEVSPTEGALKTSAKNVVRFKRNERLANDLAQALALGTTELCKELNQYDCANEVHKVALGGADPYAIGLYEGFPDTGASTTIAVDRVVLSSCDKRARADMAAPASAVVFVGFGADATADSPSVGTAITALYDRGLARAPSTTEREHLVQLFRDIAATGAPAAAANWATLSCFAVLSSNEGLFY